MKNGVNILLVSVVIFLVVCALAGYQRGFIKKIRSFVCVAGSLAAAVMLYKVIAGLIAENPFIYQRIHGFVSGIVEWIHIDASCLNHTPLEIEVGKNSFASSITETVRAVVTALVEKGESDFSVSGFSKVDYLTGISINAIAFLLVLVVSIVALRIFCNAVDLAARLPIISQINSTGGMVLGAAEGVLVVWVFFLFISLTNSIEFSNSILGMVQESQFLTVLYDTNLLSPFFK